MFGPVLHNDVFWWCGAGLSSVVDVRRVVVWRCHPEAGWLAPLCPRHAALFGVECELGPGSRAALPQGWTSDSLAGRGTEAYEAQSQCDH